MGLSEQPQHTEIHWQLSPDAPAIRAVLFDFDGTLVDSEHLHHESWLEAVEPWGVTVSWDDYVRLLVGISDTRACEFFLGLAGRAVTPEMVEYGRKRKHRIYRSRSIVELRLEPAVADWIRHSHGRVPMGVVSSSSVPDVVPILEAQGVADRMEFVVCGDHVQRLKPDPMPYRLAFDKLRRRFDIDAPSSCLAFEDSAPGFRSASGAGLTVHLVEEPAHLVQGLATWDERIVGAGAGETSVQLRPVAVV